MFIDKEKKCKECLFEVKLDLYKILLDNFNFVVLEIVVEQDLCIEINVILVECLEELGVVFNCDECIQLSQDFYDEVIGLGLFEVLLKDDIVNDILVNGL